MHATGTVLEVDDPGAGRVRLLSSPLRFGRCDTGLRRHPPRLGQHTDEVLAEGASYPDSPAPRGVGVARRGLPSAGMQVARLGRGLDSARRPSPPASGTVVSNLTPPHRRVARRARAPC